MSFRSVGVIGAGAWGTALAQTARLAGRTVRIWAHEAETAAAINERHENTGFLPGVALDRQIVASTSMADVASMDVLLLVVPAQFVRPVCRQLAGLVRSGQAVVICAKGIERDSGHLLTQVVAETLPQVAPAVLSGPCFAADVSRNKPTAVTLACADEALGKRLIYTLGHKTFRPYLSDDPVGAEIGGAVKNVLAIAAGIVDGQALGASAHAALVTRGLAELVRFGRAHGARPETLRGLSGLGDLVLTCSSPLSRNMSLGQALGQGARLSDVLRARKSVTEGVYTAQAVVQIARSKGIEMPICEAVHDIIDGRTGVEEAINRLLARPFRAENV